MPGSLIPYLIIFPIAIAVRILFVINTERHFGSNKAEIILKVKKDHIILIMVILFVEKLLKYFLNSYFDLSKSRVLIQSCVFLAVVLYILAKFNKDKSFSLKLSEGWRNANWIPKGYLSFLLLFFIWYTYTVVRDQFFK